MFEFKEWPKIPRGQNEQITITEKIDGTNACVVIENGVLLGAQSRNRIITPEADNMGFAKWVAEHSEELLSLGDGYHYGEWAGPGIQQNPHKLEQRQFFLFNTARWNDNNPNRPACCSVVPVLYEGPWDHMIIDTCLGALKDVKEADGITPEGVVVWYHKTRRYEKYTFKNPSGKWAG